MKPLKSDFDGLCLLTMSRRMSLQVLSGNTSFGVGSSRPSEKKKKNGQGRRKGRRVSMMPRVNARSGKSSRSSVGRTSQGRQSLGRQSVGRQSVGRQSAGRQSMGRSSHAYGPTVRDNRPIHDRNYIDNQVSFLLTYLCENAFNNTITQRDLLHPTSKKFGEVVNFLFRKIDPSFRFQKNLVNDVHTMFKGLAYPVQISKTSLSAVGSAHAWPTLLASLTWLVDLINYDTKATELQAKQQRDDVNAMFFDYLCSAYDHFMANDDEKYAELDDELAETFRQRDNEIILETQNIVAKNEKLRQELQELQAAASSLPGLQEKHQTYADDLIKFDEHLMKMSKVKENHQQKMNTNETKLSNKRDKLIKLETTRNELKEQLRTQDLSAQDVERISQDRSRLRMEMSSAEEVKEGLHSKMWDIEQKGNELMGALQQLIRQYTELGTSIKLLPLTAKNALGNNYEVSITSNDFHELMKSSLNTNVLNMDVKKTMKSVIMNVSEKYKQKLTSTRSVALELSESMHTVKETKQEIQDQINEFNNNISKMEELIEKEKETTELSVQQKNKETELCEELIYKLRHEPSPNMSSLRNELREVKAQLGETNIATDHARKILQRQIQSALHIATDHKSAIEQTLGSAGDQVKELQKTVLDMPVFE